MACFIRNKIKLIGLKFQQVQMIFRGFSSILIYHAHVHIETVTK